MVWGFCYLRIFKKVQSISGRSLHKFFEQKLQTDLIKISLIVPLGIFYFFSLRL
jgi:hypothetical protein